MTSDEEDYKSSEYEVNYHVTGIIIRSAYEAQNTLGCGFLEKVYERSLAIEL